MKLNKFSPEHILNLQYLLLDYLFITNEFDRHYEEVHTFQENHNVSLISVNDVFGYFELLRNRRRYFSMLSKNGYAYVSKKRGEMESLSSDSRSFQIASINELICSIHQYEMTFAAMLDYENSISWLRNLITKMRQENEEWFMKEIDQFFTMTSAVMSYSTSKENQHISLLRNEEFLSYCRKLLRKDQWLLREPEFLSWLLFILEVNGNLSFFGMEPNEIFFNVIKK